MKKFLKAFTLAEALIALGIVGIIAVLSLPNVFNNYQKRFMWQMYKKFIIYFRMQDVNIWQILLQILLLKPI